MNLVFLIGIISAFLTTGAYVPQAVKTIKSQSTGDLSLVTFSMIFTGTIMWLVYGLYQQDLPLILANTISALLSGSILAIKIKSLLTKSTD